MPTNLERYKKDLDALIKTGERLDTALVYKCNPYEIEKLVRERVGEEADRYLKSLPSFDEQYQAWYSEAKALIKQLLPDRLEDFVRHYEKPKSRKELTCETYRIEDCLQGLLVRHDHKIIVGIDAAAPHFRQSLAILKAVKARFESSLFDIRQIVQADLFDSELDAARELLQTGFIRPAGMIAGVVLEKHLAQVCTKHNLRLTKKRPTIRDFNDTLKNNKVIDTAIWRHIQRLGDLRNLCAHNGDRDPAEDEVDELIRGTEKYTKSLF